MGINTGAHHKRTFEDRLILILKFSIFLFSVLIVALVAQFIIDIWIADDDARVYKLQNRFDSLTIPVEPYSDPTERQLPTWGAEKKSHLIGTGHHSKKVQREGD